MQTDIFKYSLNTLNYQRNMRYREGIQQTSLERKPCKQISFFLIRIIVVQLKE